MKKIINKRVYNTETAKKVGYYVNEFQKVIRTMYVKNNGEKFIHYHNPFYRNITESACDEESYDEICRAYVGDNYEMILPITKEIEPIFDEWMEKSEARKEYLEECLTNYSKHNKTCAYAIWAQEYENYV